MYFLTHSPETQSRTPWNKGKLVGQKPPLKLTEIIYLRVDINVRLIFRVGNMLA